MDKLEEILTAEVTKRLWPILGGDYIGAEMWEEIGNAVHEAAADALVIARKQVEEMEAALGNCLALACDYSLNEKQARNEVASQARAALQRKGVEPE